MRQGWVVDLVCSAPGLITGSPDDMTVGVGELAWGAEVVGVVVENLRGTRRPFGLFGQGVFEPCGNAFLQWDYIVCPDLGMLRLQVCQVGGGRADGVGIIRCTQGLDLGQGYKTVGFVDIQPVLQLGLALAGCPA